MRELATLFIAIALACSACTKASETTDAKRSPKPPPPASAAPATALHIDVEIDGAPAPPIDAALLASTKPDYQEEEHRAWRVATLVGASANRDGAVVAATGEKGVTISMRAASKPGDPVPVVSMNRRGEVMVETISPDAPFPEYHGRGGRLNRPGDPLPRIAGVTKLRVYVENDASM